MTLDAFKPRRRSVLRHAAFGGAECPEEQERSVEPQVQWYSAARAQSAPWQVHCFCKDCLLAECGGFDFLLAAMPHMGLSAA